jgi:hypothetical protein
MALIWIIDYSVISAIWTRIWHPSLRYFLTMPTLNKAYLFIIYLIWACYPQKGVFLLFAYFKSNKNSKKITQFDIFYTKVLQITSRCHVMALIWIIDYSVISAIWTRIWHPSFRYEIPEKDRLILFIKMAQKIITDLLNKNVKIGENYSLTSTRYYFT